jgi:hypothetical protein
MSPDGSITWRSYLGLFFVTLSTLMYEILLTRIFSVTMWYHFAFLAISIAVFGLASGALLVYLLPNFFTARAVKRHLALFSILFAAAMPLSLATHLITPMGSGWSLPSLPAVSIQYLILSVPFALSGICVALILTRFRAQVGRLYAADMGGAALGCVALVLLLRVTDAPTAVLVVASLAGFGALLFAFEAGHRRLIVHCLAATALFGAGSIVHAALARNQNAILRPLWVKGKKEGPALHENWNSYSRIRVTGSTDELVEPRGWAFSPALEQAVKVRRLRLLIDAVAGTSITGFDGDLAAHEYLKFDVVNVAQHLRPNSRVAIIGAGGGRDVLSALVFGQRSVVAIEINEEILETINGRFGDFTGHLDRFPGVRFVNDEARSYLAREGESFEIIQASLINTFAATSAGAYVLTESTLYTVDAWTLFLRRLSPDGILTFSYWHNNRFPAAIYRMAAIAAAAVKNLGAERPREHIMVVRGPGKRQGWDVATILVGRRPFSARDIRALEALSTRMQFDLELTPRASRDPTLAKLASGRGDADFFAALPQDVTPPTDDKPFFFHLTRLSSELEALVRGEAHLSGLSPVSALWILLAVVAVLVVGVLGVPLLRWGEFSVLRGSGALCLYFASIGLGFITVEVAVMQRLIVFLGHPTYALTVLLFVLLLGSSLGSALVDGLTDAQLKRAGAPLLGLTLLALLALIVSSPRLLEAYQGLATSARVGITAGLVLPLGTAMGMALPIGMKFALAHKHTLAPWLWGINGATSVLASVVGVMVAMGFGISRSLWMGLACYGVAALALLRISRRAGVDST